MLEINFHKFENYGFILFIQFSCESIYIIINKWKFNLGCLKQKHPIYYIALTNLSDFSYLRLCYLIESEWSQFRYMII